MTETEFINRYHREKKTYQAWGEYIASKINSAIRRDYPTDEEYYSLIKIPVCPRLKADQSLIQKAFYRKKNYSNPYDDITDKVGIRYVVLLTEKIDYISDIVEKEIAWCASLDRDYQKERDEQPNHFDYQSKHYVIRSTVDIVHDGVTIPQDIPCEIQIRTLLQHAYSELTHDTTYKTKKMQKPMVHRVIARSMALIETTDELFVAVNKEIEESDIPVSDIIQELKNYSKDTLGLDITEADRTTDIIYDSLEEVLQDVRMCDIKVFVKKYDFVIGEIKERAISLQLFRSPAIILLYYLVHKMPEKLKSLWPLTFDKIEPLYLDLGESTSDN